MPTWIKFFIGLVVALLVLALGAALLAPRLIDQRQLLRDFEIEIGQSLGRPTRIESIGRLRLLPTPSIRLDGVRVLDAEAWESAAREADARKADARETNARETDAVGAPVWIAIDSLRLNAALWPLLSGRLVLAEVLLDRPQMRLSSASGQQLATASETRTHQTVAMPASGTPWDQRRRDQGHPRQGCPDQGCPDQGCPNQGRAQPWRAARPQRACRDRARSQRTLQEQARLEQAQLGQDPQRCRRSAA